MQNTNKAEELAKELYEQINTGASISDIIQIFNEYRQSEIDELTNDKNQLEMDLFSIRMESSHEIAELTKEVERLRIGIRSNQLLVWLKENNYINKDFDNVDLKEIYMKYLSTH